MRIHPQPAAGTRSLKSVVKRVLHRGSVPVKAAIGRMRFLDPRPRRFQGLYHSHAEALAAATRKGLAGYDHDEVAPVSFEAMCRVEHWDYPVLFWLGQLLSAESAVFDAGGHMGTKYRAFAPYLNFGAGVTWTVYDLPAIVRAGRTRAAQDGIHTLTFVERVADAPPPGILLASGLLQYLDRPLCDLLRQFETLPPYLLLNKVAFHDRGPVVTLERIGTALVPYQMRDKGSFLSELESFGYALADSWAIAALSHTIDTHPEIGPSESRGFLFRKA